jgi:mono/diheme cytochrome c family protein
MFDGKQLTTRAGVLALALLTAVPLPALAQGVALTFKIYCARCHGEEGKGDGPDGATLSVKPRDFADCAAMSKLSDDVIFRAIKDGGAAAGISSEMPAWAEGLSEPDIKALVTYVRSFCHE